MIDLVVVKPALALVDDRAEPADEHEHHHGDAGQHDPEAGAGAVQPVGDTHHEKQQPDRADDGPVAAMGDVITVFSVGHVFSRCVVVQDPSFAETRTVS